MDFARLNHILIPETKEERDRLRQSRLGRFAKPLLRIYLSFTTEGRFLAGFWVLAGAASVDVGGSRTYILWSLLSALLCIALFVRRRYRLDDVNISISAASDVVVGEVLPISIRVANHGASSLTAFRVEGPLLPWDGAYVQRNPVIPVLDSGEVKHAIARATFRARGEHHLDPFYIARVAPPGLSMGPVHATDGVRFVVVPRPAHIRSLSLPAVTLDEASGIRRITGLNDDPEMAGVRPYRRGDRLRDLHARTWARVGYPVVREFELPVESRVAVRLDCGSGSAEKEFESAVELAAGVIQYLVERNTTVCLAVPGADSGWLDIRKGSNALGAAMQRLGCVQRECGWPQDDPPAVSPGTSHLVIIRAWKEQQEVVAHQGTLCLTVYDDRDGRHIAGGECHIRASDLHGDIGLVL